MRRVSHFSKSDFLITTFWLQFKRVINVFYNSPVSAISNENFRRRSPFPPFSFLIPPFLKTPKNPHYYYQNPRFPAQLRQFPLNFIFRHIE